MIGKVLFGITVCLSIFVAPIGYCFEDSAIKVSIQSNQDTFKLGETIEGAIGIYNGYANGIPNIFVIKIFHEKKEVNSLTTSIGRLPFGEMKMSFKSFGIPTFTKDPANLGSWEIRVFHQGDDPLKAATTTFEIIQP